MVKRVLDKRKMAILDIEEKKIGVNVVQHYENIPGRWKITSLAQQKKPQDNIYEQRDDSDFFRSSFLDAGYKSLVPVCDADTIRARQNAIRAFQLDFPEMRRYYPMLNMMHLINVWANSATGREGEFYSGKGAKVLKRYLQEAQRLGQELEKSGRILAKIAGEFEEKLPRENIEMLVSACEKGEFDNLCIGDEGGALRIIGVVGRPLPTGENIRFLGEHNLYEQTGWSQRDFIKHGFMFGINALNEIYGVLGALYFEAAYMHRRKEQGKRVCLPKINNQGIFEMTEGEPILPTPEPVAWRSFRFDKTNSKSILNGLHSGGKTHLLCDIPLYILRGLRGFPEPALSSKIPITRRIFHALSIEKYHGRGSLESEMIRRAQEIACARPGDLFLIDEFLQHASPDAADPLEPIILDAYADTQATFVIVDHRGDSIEDGGQWKFWSPGFTESKRVITPTYKFKRGKPSKEILIKHARQLLEKIVQKLDNPEPEQKELVESRQSVFHAGRQFSWINDIERRILSGRY